MTEHFDESQQTEALLEQARTEAQGRLAQVDKEEAVGAGKPVESDAPVDDVEAT